MASPGRAWAAAVLPGRTGGARRCRPHARARDKRATVQPGRTPAGWRRRCVSSVRAHRARLEEPRELDRSRWRQGSLVTDAGLNQAEVGGLDSVEHFDVAPNVAALPGPDDEEGKGEPAEVEHTAREVGDAGVACADWAAPFRAWEGCELDGKPPRFTAGYLDAEPDDLVVVPSPNAVQQADPRRDLSQIASHAGHQRGEDLVDPIEVEAKVDQVRTRGGVGGGDAEVQVDVGIDPSQ